MKPWIVVVVFLIASLLTLAFYRGWFVFSTDDGAEKSNITLTVDQDKILNDKDAALESLNDATKSNPRVAAEQLQDGTLINVGDRKFVMKTANGEEITYSLDPEAEITCDALPCKATELLSGMKVRVTANDATPRMANRVEALDRNVTFRNAG